jgi:hypothetical protein
MDQAPKNKSFTFNNSEFIPAKPELNSIYQGRSSVERKFVVFFKSHELTFSFELISFYSDGDFQFNFSTLEYGHAFTGLGNQQELIENFILFIKTINKGHGEVKFLSFSGHYEKSTTSDFDDLKGEIIKRLRRTNRGNRVHEVEKATGEELYHLYWKFFRNDENDPRERGKYKAKDVGSIRKRIFIKILDSLGWERVPDSGEMVKYKVPEELRWP